jgi:hypothetical protein
MYLFFLCISFELIYNIQVMKKLFIQCVFVVMCFSFFVSVTPVFAQNTAPQTTTPQANTASPSLWDRFNGFVQGGLVGGLPGAFVGGATGQGVIGGAVQSYAEDKIGVVVKEFILNVIWTQARFTAWVTGVVGGLFDDMILTLTPDSNDTWKIDINTSIEAGWRILRDIASIVLIFSLLYLGIKTILDGQGFADKKTLISIIVAAILLNFSLIFTKDIAFHVSNRIGQEVLRTAILNNTDSNNTQKSFSEAMLSMIGPQQLFNANGGIENFQASSRSGGSWEQIGMFALQSVILSFVLLITVVIFLGLILMLLIRFIVFVMLMITAPLGIIAFTIPALKQHGETWWAELKKQTIYFPAFVFTMYIIFLLISTLGSGDNTFNIAATDGAVASAVAFFLNFLLIIGFLVVLLIAPSKLSAGGSSLVNSATNWTKKKATSWAGRAAGGATFGAAAALGRNTVGRGATKILSSDKIKTAAQEAKGFKGTAARALLRRADKAQDYSFDARSTKMGGEFAKKYGLGEASKGWKGSIEAKKKAYKEKMDKEKKLYGFGEMDDAQKREHTNKLNTARADRDNKAKDVQDEIKKLENARKNNPTDTATINAISESLTAKQKELEKFETEVGKLMQAGDSTYITYLKKQRHRGLNVYRRMSRTQKAALEALEKDMNKEWKEKGKAKQPKQPKSQNTSPSSGSPGTPSGGSNSTPPPNPPIILGPNGRPAQP